MADEYKAGEHWQALNRIWKALSPSERESVKDDFRLLSDMVKEKSAAPSAEAPRVTQPKSEFDFENRYLDGMSRETKRFALMCLTQNRADVYKGVMDFIAAHKIGDMDTLWDKFTAENAIPGDGEAAMREIMCVCLERARYQNLV